MESIDVARISGSARHRVTMGWALAALVLIAAVAIAVFLLVRGGDTATSAPRPALTVTVAEPSRSDWPVVIEASGAVAPWEEASIGTQIGSYQLIEVRANVGDRVRRGQILARLNPALLRAEETQLVARDAQARANDARARGLKAVGGISDQEALQFSTEAKTAAALLAAKRLELRYTAIVAPDDGVISARAATTGAVVPAGQELFRMIRRDRLEWRGELTAVQLAAVRIGQQIALLLPDGADASATIRKTAPSLDSQSRVGLLYADIAPGSGARAGMYAAGRITVGQRAAMAIPAECVIVRDGRSYVLIAPGRADAAKVELRRVTPGRRRGEAIEILGGLVGTERVVRRGAAFLNDGDLVHIVAARGPSR